MRRITGRLLDVLAALYERPGGTHGYALIRACGAPERGATVYEHLARLRADGWVTAVWESAPPGGRPARRTYTLTETGRERARRLLVERGRLAA